MNGDGAVDFAVTNPADSTLSSVPPPPALGSGASFHGRNLLGVPAVSMSPLAAYSLRYVVSGYSGPVVNIRNGATGATTDLYPSSTQDATPFSAVTYDLATSSGQSYSAWIGAATGYVTAWCESPHVPPARLLAEGTSQLLAPL